MIIYTLTPSVTESVTSECLCAFGSVGFMGDTEVLESGHCLICKYQVRRKRADGGGGKELICLGVMATQPKPATS